MAAQIVNFLPTNVGPFRFQPVLDGATYSAQVRWGLFGQRWYLFLFALSGTRIFTLPMVGSPNDFDISLTAGYFDTPLIFREASQQFEIG
jgi:hypothetical protein